MEPIGTVKNVPTTVRPDESDAGTTSPNSGTISPAREAQCTFAEIENLDDALKGCEVAMPRASDVASLRDKVEVKASTSAPSVAPAGRVDVVVTFRNKGTDAVSLYFSGEPSFRFDVEALDAKGRRAELPTTKWPGYPKGFKPEPRETKIARVILEKGGTARLKVAWDALKTKWAPDRAKTWEGRGFPRTPTTGLAPGHYTLRVVLPTLGDLESPKAPIDVTP